MNMHHPQQQTLPPQSVNGPAETYTTQDLDELNQKIQNRFIRDVVKPYSNGIRKPVHIPPTQYTIPKASEVFSAPPSSLPPASSGGGGGGGGYRIPEMGATGTTRQRRVVHVPPQYTPLVNSPSPCPLDFRFREKTSVNIACLDIHQHVGNCPVCSKLHRPYNSILMVIIVILLLIILFLAKKCFTM
uniref:Uncharacterized protein n=1 Tax=viral metagenome TaxID=1070528 RepID=A0A6C0K4B5_9ZZZZ